MLLSQALWIKPIVLPCRMMERRYGDHSPPNKMAILGPCRYPDFYFHLWLEGYALCCGHKVFLWPQPTLAITCKGTAPQLLSWGSDLFLCRKLWYPLWGLSTSLCLSQHNYWLCCVLPDTWFELDREQTDSLKCYACRSERLGYLAVWLLILW